MTNIDLVKGQALDKQAALLSEHWNKVIEWVIGSLDFTLDPNVQYLWANRDLMRARTAEWHQSTASFGYGSFISQGRQSHGSYWFELDYGRGRIQWKENYVFWMTLWSMNTKTWRKVTAGFWLQDFIYQAYGFAYIPGKLEFMARSGFSHPLEVNQSCYLLRCRIPWMEN